MTNSFSHAPTQDHNSVNQNQKIRILIVDDQKMIREGLKALIQTEPDFEIVGISDNGEDSIKQVETSQPDIVLMDMEMPGLDGVSATKIICEKFPNVKILVLSTFDTQEYVAKSLSSGAMGYLLKGTPARELTNAIRSVYLGYAQIGPGIYQNLPLIPRGETSNNSFSPLVTNSATKIGAEQLSPRANGQLAPINKAQTSSALSTTAKSNIAPRQFEQTVLLRPSPKWSHWTLAGIVGVTVFTILWAWFAKIEQVVPAMGQLQPEGKVKEVQIPTTGVVEEVKVEEGQRVEKGETLLVLDATTSEAQLKSLENIRQSVTQENKFYRALMGDRIAPNEVDQSLAKIELPREITYLARNRAELTEENELLEAQLGANSSNLSAEQQTRLRNAQAETRSRTAAARLEAEQLEKQLSQNQVQLADAREKLNTARQVLREIQQRNEKGRLQGEESLKIEEKTLESIRPLVKEGAIAGLQLDRQQQEVNDRRATMIEQQAQGKIEHDNQKQEVITAQAEIDRLEEEEQRLRLDVTQAREELINTTALSDKEILDTIAENKQKIADIDTQLNRSIVENDKRVNEIDSEISTAKQELKYQTIPAPVGGLIFDLEAYAGYVPPAGQAAEPVLKIVPEENLIAEVFIKPEDIGFVYEGMTTDVRITAFPFGEFGDVKGKVLFIGKDALEPDQTYDFPRFPAKVSLDQQFITIRGEDKKLQSGMAVQANIRVKENRTVMMLLFDQFFTGLDKFKNVR
jgi:hemolysin D